MSVCMFVLRSSDARHIGRKLSDRPSSPSSCRTRARTPTIPTCGVRRSSSSGSCDALVAHRSKCLAARQRMRATETRSRENGSKRLRFSRRQRTSSRLSTISTFKVRVVSCRFLQSCSLFVRSLIVRAICAVSFAVAAVPLSAQSQTRAF